MNKKPVILWLSDSPFINTGYSTMSRNILNGLSEEYDSYFLSHNYVGQNIPKGGVTLKDGLQFKFDVIGMGREGYCKDIILPYIQKLKPDYFVVLLDTFMLYPWIMDMNFAPAKSIFYYPTDGGGGLPQGCDRILAHFNSNVCMSKFGQRQVKEIHGMDTAYIPPTCDTDLFRPLSKLEKEKIKDEFEVLMLNGAKIKGFLKNKFIVGTVARNQGRKMLDKTLKAFAIFCKDKQDAILFMHTDVLDAASVFDLRMLASRLGLDNKICFSDIKFYDNYERKEMNKVYNVMDVFFLSTSGEGFGIPILEAMSCEIPCVVTDYTTTFELLEENGVCGISVPMQEVGKTTKELMDEGLNFKQIDDVQTINSTLTGSWCVERGLISTKKAAEGLDVYYKNSELRQTHGKKGREKALAGYTDEIVLNMWRKFLKENLNG
jgi:glycosyltransferase involved in cell wall biosynthesis